MSQTAAATQRPTGGLSHRQIMLVLSGLLLGMFLAALDQTIVSTAMRTIADHLHGQTEQAWATTAYLITSTISTPLYGKLSDMYGRKGFYLFAISIFIIGSMLCGTATSMYELAGYRALQGIGAGGLMSLAFTIVGDVVPPRERAKYQAYFMSVWATASVLGPVLGGFFAGQDTILGVAGWRWIFYINVPIGLAALAVVSRFLNLPHVRRDHRIDYVGAMLLSVGVIPLLVVAEKGNEWGWTSPESLTSIIGGLVAVVVFVFWEIRMREEAILPMRFFRNSVFSVTGVMSFIVGAGMFGGMVSIPLYLQIVKGQSPTRAGLLLLPMMAGIMASSAISGQVMSKTGKYKIFPIVGSALMICALVLLSTLKVDTSLWIVGCFIFVMGAGLGCAMQTLVVAVQNAMPPRDMGVATSSSTFFRSMGGTFGAAAFLSILFNTVPDNIKSRCVAAGTQVAQQCAKFGGAGGATGKSQLNDTTFIAKLPVIFKNIILGGFSDSMHVMFLAAAVLMVPAFVLAFFVKEIPLRSSSGIAAAQEERADAAEAAAEAAANLTKSESAVL
jgi:EmrB/QacA subfamily drug resistance transporter